MKKVIISIALLSALFFFPRYAISQQQAAYQVPGSYTFDYEVVQQVTGENKNAVGPKTVTYYYSQAGDYTAIKSDNKNNSLIIFTKDGTSVIIDDQKKTITIFRMNNMLSQLSKTAAQYNKNTPSTAPARHDSSNFKFAKTGKTKQVSGYTAEEYSFTDSKGEKGSVWYAKVDFNTGLFSMMGMGAATMPGAGMNRPTQSPAYPQINDPHMLVTETENNSHPGETLTTQSIEKKSIIITTKGYTINNLSNMMGQ